MRSRLRKDLTAALKARNAVAVSALRSAIAAIENAESFDVNLTEPSPATSQHFAGATAGVGSSEVARRVLSEVDLIAIVRGEVEERGQAADEYAKLGKVDPAERLRSEAEVLREYLPAEA
jgi:uncharacterized protein